MRRGLPFWRILAPILNLLGDHSPHHCRLGELERMVNLGLVPEVALTAWLMVLFPGYEDLSISRILGTKARNWLHFEEVCKELPCLEPRSIAWLKDRCTRRQRWPGIHEWRKKLKMSFLCKAQRLTSWDRTAELLTCTSEADGRG